MRNDRTVYGCAELSFISHCYFLIANLLHCPHFTQFHPRCQPSSSANVRPKIWAEYTASSMVLPSAPTSTSTQPGERC